MTTKRIRITNLSEYPQAAAEFIRAIGDRRIFAFYGKMGVGKTTFIKSLCEELGVDVEALKAAGYVAIGE